MASYSRRWSGDSYTQIQSSYVRVAQVDGEWQNAIQRVSYSDYDGELFLQCYKGKAWIHSIGKLVDASEE